MRDIEFRGKCIDNDEWIYGSYVNGGLTVDSNIEDATITKYGCYAIAIIPETLGQYTGLKDKTGRKIFEGDRLRYEYDGEEQIFVVKWYDEWSCFGYEIIERGYETGDIEFPEDRPYPEIIGNIYEK